MYLVYWPLSLSPFDPDKATAPLPCSHMIELCVPAQCPAHSKFLGIPKPNSCASWVTQKARGCDVLHCTPDPTHPLQRLSIGTLKNRQGLRLSHTALTAEGPWQNLTVPPYLIS